MRYHSGPEWTWEQWHWRCTPHSPKPQHYWNLSMRLFSVISSGGGGLTPLQWCSRCILQPQLTRLYYRLVTDSSFLIADNRLRILKGIEIWNLNWQCQNIDVFLFGVLFYHLFVFLMVNQHLWSIQCQNHLYRSTIIVLFTVAIRGFIAFLKVFVQNCVRMHSTMLQTSMLAITQRGLPPYDL